jgi:hypothetical protein
MNKILIALTVFIVMLVPVKAHHAAHAFFGGEIVLIKGTLTGSKLMNPHSYFRLTMDDGTEWLFETGGSGSMLRNDGLTKEDFATGRRVAMSGDSNKEGRKNARIHTVAFYGETDEDDIVLYIISARMPNEDWARDISKSAVPCNEGTMARCYSISKALRTEINSKYGDEPMLW